MTLATFFNTANTAGIDFTSAYVVPSAGTWSENVNPGPPFTPGTKVNTANGGEAVFVKLSTGGVTGTGYVIVVPLGDYTSAVMMSNSVGNFGDIVGASLCSTAQSSGDYIWIQTKGACAAVRANAAAVISTALCSTSTAGALDDANGAGTKNLPGIVFTQTATGAGLFTAELNNPTVGSTN